MASEYLKWKYRDVEPDKPIELSPAEKRKNWWHYHKWHVGIVLLLAAIACNILWHALTQIKPDYQVAYVGENALPDDTAAAIEAGFAALGEDLNGDGRVVVQFNQYAFASDADPSMAYAVQAQVMGDIVDGESYFFILEDPKQFQEDYYCLCRLDGSLPEDEHSDPEELSLQWTQCPVLMSLDLGSYSYNLMGETVSGDSGELVEPLFLARRGFLGKTAAYPEGCAALWDKLTQGAFS